MRGDRGVSVRTRTERSRYERVSALVLLCLLLSPLMLWYEMRGFAPIDLDVYLAAGRAFIRGEGLYQPGFGQGLARPLPYTYPPFLAALMSLVAWLPRRVVAVAWAVVNVGTLAWIVRVSFAPLLSRVRYPALCLAGLTGLFCLTTTMTDLLFYGQIGVVLTALCVADMREYEGRLPRGVLVGVATALKLTPALFVLYWVVTRRYRAAAVAVITTFSLWLITALPRPDLSWQYWTTVVFDVGRVAGDASIAANQSLNGSLLRLGIQAPALVWLAIAGPLLCIGLLRAKQAHERGSEVGAACYVGLATLVVSPISWIHHAVWIVPVAGVLLGTGTSRRGRYAFGVVMLLFLARLPYWSEVLTIPSSIDGVVTNAYVITFVVLLVSRLMLPPATAPDAVVAASTRTRADEPNRIASRG